MRFLVHIPRHSVDARMCTGQDEAYYSVAAIRDKQVVANAERGGMVSILPFFCLCCIFILRSLPISDHDFVGDAQYEVYYLVKWEGYDESENTWEAADSLTSSGDEMVTAMIAEYEEKERKKSSGGEPRELASASREYVYMRATFCACFPHRPGMVAPLWCNCQSWVWCKGCAVLRRLAASRKTTCNTAGCAQSSAS